MQYRLILSAILFLAAVNQNAISQKSAIPEVRFSDFQKQLNRQSDSVYVINFWATWCAPCRKELPEFEQVYKDFAGKNVRVLLVSLDFPKQAQSILPKFLAENNISAPVILLNEPDANEWIDKVDPGWSGALPATLIYKNKSRKFFEKELTYTEISNYISSFNKL